MGNSSQKVFRATRSGEKEPDGLAVLTLVLWLMTLATGLVGLGLSDPPPKPPAREPEPLRAQLIEVAIDTELTQTAVDDSPSASEQQPAADAPPQPPAPPLPMVAAPGPAIAFEVPVEGPVQIVPVARAPPAPPAAPVVQPMRQRPPVKPAVQRLNYGQGEGRQPAPEYPAAAVLERQEGVIGVRFTVGEDGRVLNAEVVTPSRWPLLNQAALLAVRYRWNFHSGSARIYEVSIRFKLNGL
jgi:TonB family protein